MSEITNLAFESAEVSKMKFEIGGADLYLKENDNNSEIKITLQKGEPDLLQVKLQENKLKISYEKNGKISKDDFGEIVVSIPSQKQFEKFKLEIGAGEAEIDIPQLLAKTMKLEIGAGKLYVNKASASERLEVSVGAGKAELSHMMAGELSINCGVGRCNFEGTLLHNMEVECGVGHVDVQLTGKESDYNYSVSCALGKIKINDNSISALVSEKEVQHTNAVGNISLECGLGKINLTTAEV